MPVNHLYEPFDNPPLPPSPPLDRHIREGIGVFCKNCGSTKSISMKLNFFGRRLCDNPKCPFSKPVKLMKSN